LTALLCVHGHFYQPPREDPWTGAIPNEGGAEPFANFNEKITAECYAPNAVLSNYSRLSFDVGPTLARWLREANQPVHNAIVDQARLGGNAIAQAYNHTILPLATRRDKQTQVLWGVVDFEHRFGYRPRGLWLPETAADTETLEVLAEHEIEFTILAPWQAADENVDVRVPYRVRLPNGRSIVVFFFDRGLSGAVSFDPAATRSAKRFVSDWLGDPAQRDGLTMVASDGELYGHHQPARERFLHDLLFAEAERSGYEVILPATYLDRYGVEAETQLNEPAAWSCDHGVARWAEGCSCTRGDSRWKGVVSRAMSELTQKMDTAFQDVGGQLLHDPWAARDDYIGVVLGREPLAELLQRHAARTLSADDRERAALLLEGQYYGQWMHTSCGFFWEELNRLEMRNNLAYAAKAIRCIEAATGVSLDADFRAALRPALSGRTSLNGEEVYLDVSKGRSMSEPGAA
jgi:alpha-amylase/alpha-mannosidase (GH57 family)